MHTIYKAPQASLLDNIKTDLLEGRSVRLQAKGWSMLPMIWNERDTLVLDPISQEQLKVGMIVFAQTGSGRYIIHRIARIVGTRIELRGDGNPYQEEYVHPQTVFGELVEVQQKNRCLKKVIGVGGLMLCYGLRMEISAEYFCSFIGAYS